MITFIQEIETEKKPIARCGNYVSSALTYYENLTTLARIVSENLQIGININVVRFNNIPIRLENLLLDITITATEMAAETIEI